MLLKMTRVQIIGSRTQLDATIASLHRLGVLHIADAARATALPSLALDESRVRLQQDLSLLVTRLDGLVQLLPEVNPEPALALPTAPREAREFADWVRARLDANAPAIQALARRRDELQAEALALPRYETTLRKFAPLTVEVDELKGYDTAALLIDKASRDVLELLRMQVERLTQSKYQIIAREVDDRTIAALLIYPRAFSEQIQALLGQQDLTQVRLPRQLAGLTWRDALAAVEQRQQEVQQEMTRLDAQFAAHARKWRAVFVKWRRACKNRLQELARLNQFGATQYTFVVEGWVPQRDLARLRETLTREVGTQVLVNVVERAETEPAEIPIALENPGPMKPFEMFVRMMALPRYGAFDPTPVLALFLPLFFGIMLGDIGYGVLLLAGAWYVKRRYAGRESIRDIAQILIYGSFWTILFGFLYGELFGTLGEAFGLHPLWMAREGEQILVLFAFALGLGAVQVVMGLLLGVWETWRAREHRELAQKIGMLVVLMAIFGMVGMATNFLPADLITPVVVALLIGLVLLIIPAGPLGLILGPLEVIGTVGNILSYLRLTAIGLASVYLALVANEMGGLIGNLLVGVILALLLHALNFALGILSPSIQSLRLHYVEFFRQFYQGGGEAYHPFKLE
jgi:V/A-type H+-transporting ATPase subunit I